MECIPWKKYLFVHQYVFNMTIFYIIAYTSMILWIIPPFKQYKTEYFFYFLILALADPVWMISLKVFHLLLNGRSLVLGLLLLSSLITTVKLKRIMYLASLIIFILSISFSFDKNLYMYSAFVLHIIILGKIILNLLNRIFYSQSLNLFLFLLIFYESISIFKHLAVITNNQTGPISWWVGGMIQLLFAVPFAFININTKEFPIHRKLDQIK